MRADRTRCCRVVADISAIKRAESVRLELLRGMAAAQEQERRRIARELHDQVGQTVTGLSLGLRSLQEGLPTFGADPAMRDRLDWLRSLAAEIGQDIHRAASDLRPLALDDFGLIAAVPRSTSWRLPHMRIARMFKACWPQVPMAIF